MHGFGEIEIEGKEEGGEEVGFRENAPSSSIISMLGEMSIDRLAG